MVKRDSGIGILFICGRTRNRGETVIRSTNRMIIPFLYSFLIRNLFSHRERFFSLIFSIKRENKIVIKPRKPMYMLNLPAVSERYIATDRNTIESAAGKYELIEIKRIMVRSVNNRMREKLAREFKGIPYRIKEKQRTNTKAENMESFLLSSVRRRNRGKIDIA